MSRSACSSSRQRRGVDRRLVAQLPRQLVEVDVVHPGAGVRLGELVGEVVEVGEVLEYAGAVAEAEALLAVEPLGAAPVLAGPQRLEVGVELGQRLHQVRRPERLLGQRVQLVALLLGHRVAHPLGGGGALGERVEQLVDVLRVLGEEVAVLVHELAELLGRVLAAAGAPRAARLRSWSISLTAARSSSVAFSSACFIPANRWSSISRPSRSLIFS